MTLKSFFGRKSLDPRSMNTTLTFSSAAEVSTGLICVCIPTLAPLAYRRRPVRPSESVLNGESRSRRIHLPGTKTSTSLDEQELWSKVDLELQQQHGSSHTVGIRAPPTAVVTGIEGGLEKPVLQDGGHRMYDTAFENRGGDLDEPSRAMDILTTVRMEHSYV